MRIMILLKKECIIIVKDGWRTQDLVMTFKWGISEYFSMLRICEFHGHCIMQVTLLMCQSGLWQTDWLSQFSVYFEVLDRSIGNLMKSFKPIYHHLFVLTECHGHSVWVQKQNFHRAFFNGAACTRQDERSSFTVINWGRRDTDWKLGEYVRYVIEISWLLEHIWE